MTPGNQFCLAVWVGLVFVTTGVCVAQQPSAENTPITNSKAVIYSPGVNPSAEPIPLGHGPHILIDDYLIASQENVTREVNVPQRDSSIPNPVVTGKEDGCFQPYLTVIHYPQSHRFRMWYGHRTENLNMGGSHLGHVESEDGIHWKRPVQILEDPAPIQFGSSVLDDGPDYPDPAKRFKYAWWHDGGLKIAVSPDGLKWTPLAEGVVLPHNHDINSIWFDSLRKRYVATISVYRKGDKWSGDRRITMQSYSDDLLKWEPPHYVITPDDSRDQGETQFYAMDGFIARGDLVIGMVKVLRDDLKADDPPDPPDAYGIGYTALAWSRDGETWFRDQAHFFDPDPQKGTWDHAHAWIDEQVPVDKEVYLYYGGYARGHKVNRFEERQIGLLKIKQDRYVARKAGDEVGRIVTPPIVFDATRLTLNIDAHDGSATVQILDSDGQPLPGFAHEDCPLISEDAIKAPVKWAKTLDSLKGKAVRIEFKLRDACLFAFDFD